MSTKTDRVGLGWLLALLLLLAVGPASAEEAALEFRASDKSFTISTVDDFRVSYNPHAILSLASLDEMAVVVTKRKAESTIDKIYDTFPKTLPADYPCSGRVMITIDGVQAAAFVIDGMFPPQGEPTHQTLLAVAIRDGQEYNFMVHYPLEDEKSGLERANELLGKVKWAPLPAADESKKP